MDLSFCYGRLGNGVAVFGGSPGLQAGEVGFQAYVKYGSSDSASALVALQSFFRDYINS